MTNNHLLKKLKASIEANLKKNIYNSKTDIKIRDLHIGDILVSRCFLDGALDNCYFKLINVEEEKSVYLLKCDMKGNIYTDTDLDEFYSIKDYLKNDKLYELAEDLNLSPKH